MYLKCVLNPPKKMAVFENGDLWVDTHWIFFFVNICRFLDRFRSNFASDYLKMFRMSSFSYSNY